MLNRNGYMLVKYEGKIVDNDVNNNVVASGKRINTRHKYNEIMSKLKEYYESGLNEYKMNLIEKDFKKGYFICSHNGYKMLFAVMPYSSRHIKDIVI